MIDVHVAVRVDLPRPLLLLRVGVQILFFMVGAAAAFQAAAAAAYQSMRLAAGCEPDEADTAENILAADKIAADTDATIEL